VIGCHRFAFYLIFRSFVHGRFMHKKDAAMNSDEQAGSKLKNISCRRFCLLPQ
jgi:hypothetical protein